MLSFQTVSNHHSKVAKKNSATVAMTVFYSQVYFERRKAHTPTIN